MHRPYHCTLSEIFEFISIAFNIGCPDAQLISIYQGQNAAELVESESSDIVVLDIGLPDMSGFDVLKDMTIFLC